MTTLTEKEIYDLVSNNGPSRIVIDSQGMALSLSRAQEHTGRHVPYDVVFVRDDKWCLGASFALEQTAYLLWRREWIGEVRRCVVDKASTWFAKSYMRSDQ